MASFFGQDIQAVLQSDVFQQMLQTLTSDTGRRTFGALAALGLAYSINKTLNGIALNSFGTSQWDWRREIVLITGGSNGLGELVVRKLAKKSIKVVVVDLYPPKKPFPINVNFYKLDVTSSDQVKKVAQAIRREVGEPIVLVNNAGTGSGKSILEETEEQVETIFKVNSISHFRMVKEFLPHMIRQNHGHIVTIASMAGVVTVVSNVSYSCSKTAAISFHEGLTQELKYKYNASKVRTSVIMPSWIGIGLLASQLEKGSFSDKVLDPNFVADSIVNQILRGKSGQVFLPHHYSLIAGIRGFPTWLQEMLRGSRSSVLME